MPVQKNSGLVRRAVSNRHEEIISILKRQGSVSILSLAEQIGCSPATIRRDLLYLGKRVANLKRFHGAVGLELSEVPSSMPVMVDRPLSDKFTVNMSEKMAIAEKVANFLPEHCVVGLNGGTTTTMIARQLMAIQKPMTVVTNSVNIAYELANSPISVVVVGGMLNADNYETTGPLAMRLLKEFHLDWAVLGANGVDPRFGVSAIAESEAAVGHVFSEQADGVIVAVDHSKLGSRALFRMLEWDQVDWLATSWKGENLLREWGAVADYQSSDEACLIRTKLLIL
jgi:DeoR family transcriptional regulator of aga operon